MFYCFGVVIQYYWCNIYIYGFLVDKLLFNYVVLVVGVLMFVIGEFLNFYYYYILVSLRFVGILIGYVVLYVGLFYYFVCFYYFGLVLCLLFVNIQI